MEYDVFQDDTTFFFINLHEQTTNLMYSSTSFHLLDASSFITPKLSTLNMSTTNKITCAMNVELLHHLVRKQAV